VLHICVSMQEWQPGSLRNCCCRIGGNESRMTELKIKLEEFCKATMTNKHCCATNDCDNGGDGSLNRTE
jgi:hypothetical protein